MKWANIQQILYVVDALGLLFQMLYKVWAQDIFYWFIIELTDLVSPVIEFAR